MDCNLLFLLTNDQSVKTEPKLHRNKWPKTKPYLKILYSANYRLLNFAFEESLKYR